MKTTATTAAALFVLTYTTAADQITTHYANDRRELFAILLDIQAKGTPIYHATIKSA
jgi:hypothetical protein